MKMVIIFIMLNLGGAANVGIKKSMYEELEEKDLQRLLEERDRYIRRLEYKNQRLIQDKNNFFQKGLNNGDDVNQMLFFTKKFQEQNQRTFQLLSEIGDRLQKIVELLTTPSDLSHSSQDLKKILLCIGQKNDGGNLSDESSMYDGPQSAQSNMMKKLEHLEIIADRFRTTFLDQHKQLAQLSKKFKSVKKIHQQEKKTYFQEIQDQRQKKEHFKLCLENTQTEKNEILNYIATISVKEKLENYEKMDRKGLIVFIKKLLYRIQDLQIQKINYLQANNKKNKIAFQKYNQLLTEVKNFKEMGRLGRSLG